MTELEPALQRWRLVLGQPADAQLGAGLGAEALARDAALDWLYGRDEELGRRDIRGRGPRGAGLEGSVLTTVDWLDDIHRLFPKETIERLERDAVECYQIEEIVTNSEVLERIEPNQTLLKAVLRTKHLMNPEVLRLARRIIEAVVRELMERMAVEVRRAFSGTRARQSSRLKRANTFDLKRTLRANLKHYRPRDQKVLVETAYFFARTRRQLHPWQLILLVDQSGSMVGSVIHAAVTAACLWGLPGVTTHLAAFDTQVVDLTSEVADPVELLLKVQLGGGTDINKALTYGAQLVTDPRRAIVVLITDLFEGGDQFALVQLGRRLVEQGTHLLVLAALDEEANPVFDRELGQRLADVGAGVGAMTPGQLAQFIAEKVGR